MKIIIILLFAIIQFTFAQVPRELSVIFEVAGQDSGALLGSYVKGVGDLNKDGYDDVAVSASGQLLTYIYFGGETMSQEPSLILEGGGTIASGDLNGDGWIDLVIEKSYLDTVNIYWGGLNMDEEPDITLHSENRYDGFGRNSMAVGDINGDGITDLVIGASGYPYLDTVSNIYWRGKIYVYTGGYPFDTIPSATFLGDTLKSELAKDLTIGDVNNDGYDDIVALGYNQLSPIVTEKYFYISIFLGELMFQMEKNFYIDSRNVQEGFKHNVVCLDADGDGVDDILVNKVYIFKGRTEIDTIPIYYIPPPNNDTISFGSYPWISGGGDYNKDGFKDMLLSRTEGYPFGVPGVFLYLNRLNHPGQYVAYRIFSEHWWSAKLYGRPENAGDVNNDGVDDIISSAPTEYLYNEGFFGIYSGDTTLLTDIENWDEEIIKDFNLKQNYPNPFNPETTIEYSLTTKEIVTIKIYDTVGKEVITIINSEEQTAGSHTIKWAGTDNQGNWLSSGVYYYQLITTNGTQTKKALYIK